MEWQAFEIRPCQLILLILVLIQSTCIQCNPIKVTFEVTRRTLIQVPKIHLDKPDSYICMAVPITDLEFSTVGIARWDMVIFVQEGPLCLEAGMGESNNHSGTVFPEDVGIQLGKDVKLNYVVIQTHFKEAVPDPDALKSNPTNVTLLLTEESRNYSYQKVILYSSGYIPAFSEDFKVELICKWESIPVSLYEYFAHAHNYDFKAEITCKWGGVPVNVYEYSAHTHDSGQLLEGYIVRNNTALLVTKEKPKGKSHDKTKIKGGTIEIKPGDTLAVRCTYRNTGPNKINFGLGGSDEMCNLALTFEYDAKEIAASVKCSSDAQDKVWCPKNAGDQIGVLCDLQQAASNNMAPEDIHGIIM